MEMRVPPPPPSPPPPPCWIFKPDANLEGSWNTAGEKMCKWRFGVLSEAMAACETEPNCDGVTRDGGVNCPIEGADYGYDPRQLVERILANV